MTLLPVPDYFQEETQEALRAQVEWLVREVGVDNSFFLHLLGVDDRTFADWRAAQASLLPEDEQTLHTFWHMTLHLLSFLNCAADRIRDLFHQFMPARRRGEDSPLTPPWSGSTLRGFLEAGGARAIDRVECWVTGLRFGDPYAA